MTTNSIFILKPIWDLLYEDAKKDREEMDSLKKRLEQCNEVSIQLYKQEIEELKNRIQTLEQENSALKAADNYKSIIIDDAAYMTEANAPAHVYAEEKVVNEVIVEPPKEEEESTKTVKMVGEKTKKEYQREYQRAYRKKQKQITMNV